MLDQEYDVMRHVEDDYWWYILLRELVVDTLSRGLGGRPGATVLDAGCGTGGTLQELQRHHPDWSLRGFDISPLALAHTRRRGFERVVEGSVDAIPFPDHSQDALISLDVICCRGLDPEKALGEFARVLRPGGLLVLNLPAFSVLRGQHDVAVGSERRFTPSAVRHLCCRHGFTVQRLHGWNAWMVPIFLIWRPISRRLISAPEQARSDLAPLAPQLNALLLAIGRLDARFCRWLSVGIGTSLLTVAVRSET